jgi:Tfp pilus assembly protein PilW
MISPKFKSGLAIVALFLSSLVHTNALALQMPGTGTIAPNQPANPSKSFNWAGYAATGGNFTSVTGSWIVPSVTNQTRLSADAAWVGIGGVNSQDLIQAGTQAITNNAGQTTYQAWYEILPNSSVSIPITVRPGDSVTASIQNQGNNLWNISLKDITSGQNFQINIPYTSSFSSAEWIQEMPSSPNGFIPLDNFGSLQFTAASAVQDGNTVTPGQSGAQPMTMINTSGQTLATVSALGDDGASFTVNRSDEVVTPTSAPGQVRGVSRRGRGGQQYISLPTSIGYSSPGSPWQLLKIFSSSFGPYTRITVTQ